MFVWKTNHSLAFVSKVCIYNSATTSAYFVMTMVCNRLHVGAC